VKTNQVIQKVTVDIGERFRFNTALAAIMELSNDVSVALSRGQGGGAGGIRGTSTASPCWRTRCR